MIFDANTTSLGSSIPMAEGYNGAEGIALALVESARNDYAMFRAMLDADARELSLRKNGYVSESEIMALTEATGGSIFKKIADLFKKLVAKIKGIFSNFIARFRGLYMKDKDLVKKYGNQIIRKSNIGNLEVKWRKLKSGNSFETIAKMYDSADNTVDEAIDKIDSQQWDTDVAKRWNKVTDDGTIDSAADYREKCMEEAFEDDSPETYKISEIGGIRKIINEFETASKLISKMESNVKKITLKLDKKVKEYDKKANDAAKEYRQVADNDPEKSTKKTESETASHEYDMAVVVNDFTLAECNVNIEVTKIYYKQLKAAFMKAATANNDKLEESAIYAQAVAEAAEQEVEDVISGAISKEELSKINNASKDVIDADVSSDPDKLVYDSDYYTDNQSYVKTDGYKDSTIVGTEESGFFSSLLY